MLLWLYGKLILFLFSIVSKLLSVLGTFFLFGSNGYVHRFTKKIQLKTGSPNKNQADQIDQKGSELSPYVTALHWDLSINWTSSIA